MDKLGWVNFGYVYYRIHGPKYLAVRIKYHYDKCELWIVDMRPNRTKIYLVDKKLGVWNLETESIMKYLILFIVFLATN